MGPHLQRPTTQRVPQARIGSDAGTAALIQASLRHVSSAAVQAGVAGAMRNLSMAPEAAQRIVGGGGVDALIAAAAAHTASAIVQAGDARGPTD